MQLETRRWTCAQCHWRSHDTAVEGSALPKCKNCQSQITPAMVQQRTPTLTIDDLRKVAARPAASTPPAPDMINHPAHYTSHPSGVECITITEHLPFNVGNAIKYLWRCDEKGSTESDLRKAAWYVQRELQRRGFSS